LKTHRTPHPRTECHTLCMLSLHMCKILKMATGYNMKQQAPHLLPAILLAVINMKIIYGKDRYVGENYFVFELLCYVS